MKIFQAIKAFVQWMIDQRKPILTYAVFVAFLTAFVKTSIVSRDLQPLDTGWVALLALLLGIDLSHSAYVQKLEGQNGEKTDATK